ncbi:MAG: hypothetical protein IPG96_10495 [Proteobacteria bacterium]|nr:hypothetical protein [Pseudomonadota bacterium]
MDSLPSADLVARGLADLRRGRETAAALLVAVARARLEDLGTPVPALPGPLDPCPELRLYRLLRRTHPTDAYSRYNALLRQIVSYTRARAPGATRTPPARRNPTRGVLSAR